MQGVSYPSIYDDAVGQQYIGCRLMQYGAYIAAYIAVGARLMEEISERLKGAHLTVNGC